VVRPAAAACSLAKFAPMLSRFALIHWMTAGETYKGEFMGTSTLVAGTCVRVEKWLRPRQPISRDYLALIIYQEVFGKLNVGVSDAS
jgi:hypothetical protein